MASRYAHDETYVLRNSARKKAIPSAENGRIYKWKALAALAGAVVSAGAVSAAYMTLNNDATAGGNDNQLMTLEAKHAQLRGSEVATQREPSTVSEPLEFDAVDMDKNGELVFSDVEEFLMAESLATEEAIQNDPSLSEAIKATKIELVRDVYRLKLECWTAVFNKITENSAVPMLHREQFALFAELIGMSCPDASIVNHDESVHTETTEPLLHTPEETTVTSPMEQSPEEVKESELINDPSGFVDIDTNHDEVVDAKELQSYWKAYFAQMVTTIEDDASLSKEAKAIKLDFVNNAWTQRMMCIDNALEKLEQDHVLVTPETYPLLQSLLGTGCETGAVDEDIAVFTGEGTVEPVLGVPTPEETAPAEQIVDSPLMIVDAPPVVRGEPMVEEPAQVVEEIENSPVFKLMDRNHDKVLDKHEVDRFLNDNYDSIIQHTQEDDSTSVEQRNSLVHELEKERTHQLECVAFAFDKMMTEKMLVSPETYEMFEQLATEGCALHNGDVDIAPVVDAVNTGPEPVAQPELPTEHSPIGGNHGEVPVEENATDAPFEPVIEVGTDTPVVEPVTESPTPHAHVEEHGVDSPVEMPTDTPLEVTTDAPIEEQPTATDVESAPDTLVHEQEPTTNGHVEEEQATEAPFLVATGPSEEVAYETDSPVIDVATQLPPVEPLPELEHHDVVDVPNPAEIPSDPQPGPPIYPNTGNDNSEELKGMLMKEFGLDKPPVDGEPAGITETAPSHQDEASEKEQLKEALMNILAPHVTAPEEPGATEQVDPAPGHEGEASEREQLKEALMNALAPEVTGQEEPGLEPPVGVTEEVEPAPGHQDEASEKEQMKEALMNVLAPQFTAPERPVVSITQDNGSWNWLHPAVKTYGKVKDADGDSVKLPTVYHHLMEERTTRTQELMSALLRTELDFKHTITCLNKGVQKFKKPVMSHDEYTSLVQWMNEKCVNPDEVQEEVEEEHKKDADKRFMTKEEFKALIAKHFQPVIDDFEAGRVSLEHAITHAKTLQSKISQCIDLATQNALSSSSGKLRDAMLPPSLDWIVNTCVDQP